MKTIRKTIVVATLAIMTIGSTGCVTREETGSLLGAAVGGIVGNQVGDGQGRAIVTAAGAVIGAIAGGAIGAHLDQAALQAQSQATVRALSTAQVGGEPVVWNAPPRSRTPASGTIRITREGRETSTGNRCREYRQTVRIGDETKELIGKACLTATGAWRAI